MTSMCLSCHKEIGWLTQQGRGLHARDAKGECAKCHPDHAGRDFALIDWPGGAKERFDHRKAGWELTGAHVETTCDKCHTSELRASPAARLSPRPAGHAGWVGLEQTCVSCHEDVHERTLARTCERCHDTRDWSPAPGFDHARTDYPLTGKHREVKCDGCHAERGIFRVASFAQCSGCHRDPHGGRFGAKCADCHTTGAWATVNKASFDHSRTRYPLRGKHAAATCDGCHGRSMAQPRPAFATCASCHRDPHRGEATLAGRAVDCASCHGVEGFTPSTFTVAQHRATDYPLEGKHATVACGTCHAAGGGAREVGGGRLVRQASAAKTRFRMAHARCGDCHGDAHAGQVAKRPDGGACESCHRVAGWAPSTYAAAEHARLRITLEGRHGEIACGACHAPARRGIPAIVTRASLGPAGVVIRPGEVTCSACHVDPHGRRFASMTSAPSAEGCTACHGYARWKPSAVDAAAHAAFSFPLEGAHAATPCVACHEEMKRPAARGTLLLAHPPMARLAFDGKRSACTDCHRSPHGEQFASRADRGACESCHDVAGYVPAARFDHDRDAAFKLAGAHARVPCAGCHRSTTTGASTMVIYRPLSTKCESCHAAEPSGPSRSSAPSTRTSRGGA